MIQVVGVDIRAGMGGGVGSLPMILNPDLLDLVRTPKGGQSNLTGLVLGRGMVECDVTR